MTALLLVLGIVLFVLLVVVHELGHYLVAVRNGVKAEEFGIGFPPRIWGKKLKNGTLFSLNLIPIGGFVRLKGENDADTAKGTYGAASLWVKTKIMTAGVAMNLITALILLTILALVGLPKVIDNQFTVASDTKVVRQEVRVSFVEPGSPADIAGLEEGDQLLAITGVNTESGAGEVVCLSLDCPSTGTKRVDIATQEKLPEITRQFAGQTVKVEYKQDGNIQIKSVMLRSFEEVEQSQATDNPKGYLGISPAEYSIQRSTWSAPIVAVGLAKQITELTFKGLGQLVSGVFSGSASEAAKQVAGPVGIVVLLKDGTLLGYQFILFIIAVISLTLAIMNVLPIPALDGGRLFVTWLYRLLRRPLTKQAEQLIHGMGFLFLMIVFVLITIVDVKRFF